MYDKYHNNLLWNDKRSDRKSDGRSYYKGIEKAVKKAIKEVTSHRPQNRWGRDWRIMYFLIEETTENERE
jgi:hypothetical protein